ncbi:MAG: transposase, partial [Gammaproteobacteria bacterium]
MSAVKTIRKKYSPEFKDQVLKRIAMDGVARVSKDMGIAESQLYSW